MKKTQIKYILNRTYQEIGLNAIFLIDFLLRDLTIFSTIRRLLFNTISDIGRGTRIRKGQYISNTNKLKIGKNCFINRGNLFDNSGKIEIGDNCSIGYDNKFITTLHYEKGKNEQQKGDFTSYSQDIKIGNSVWITTGCTILPGTIIGDNVILAAGSVARGELESGYIYGGTPAKQLRKTKGFISKTY